MENSGKKCFFILFCANTILQYKPSLVVITSFGKCLKAVLQGETRLVLINMDLLEKNRESTEVETKYKC